MFCKVIRWLAAQSVVFDRDATRGRRARRQCTLDRAWRIAGHGGAVRIARAAVAGGRPGTTGRGNAPHAGRRGRVGCLGLDAMWQLAGFFLPWLGEPGRGRALGVGQVKFSGQVTPSAKLLRYEIDIRRVMRGKLALVIADGRTYVDDRPIYVATDLRVGLFQSTEG